MTHPSRKLIFIALTLLWLWGTPWLRGYAQLPQSKPITLEMPAEPDPLEPLQPYKPFAPLLAGDLLVADTENSNSSLPGIDTDRGNWPNCATAVPLGSLQVEGGVDWTLNTDHSQTLDTPELLVRAGVFPNTELRLYIPDFYTTWDGSPNSSSWSDVGIGIRRQMGPFKGWNMAITPFINFPTGAVNVSGSGVDPNLELTFDRQLSDNDSFDAMLGFYTQPLNGSDHFNISPSVSWVHAINNKLSTFLDYVAFFPTQGGTVQFAHFGGTYMLSKTQVLDLQISVGFTEATPSLSIAFGYSVRWDRLHRTRQHSPRLSAAVNP